MESRLDARGGDFLIHIESTQKCLNTVNEVTLTATFKSKAMPTGVALDASDNVLEPGNAGLANATKFIVFGPDIDGVNTDTFGSNADPYTVIDDFTGAVLNETVLLTAGYSAGDVTTLKGAAGLAGVKWVAEPVKSSVQTN